ncbi:transcription factor ABORTED MICROSPORES-like [Asparagus officinalis]|uniref:transcription factor ABORTED MICROSPORES-like n=1 Tax=Asparagus officinalis TaxID=4686 RepID=UPI00098E5B79|nr:transcription factor ABORTED MICROSPORES-like [Asparagus officinalis]
MGRNKFHVTVKCKNKPGGFVELLETIARNGLEITEISSFAFSGFSLIVFGVEAKGEKEITIAELRKLLLMIIGVPEENDKGVTVNE